jgi:hypothetical protein
MGKNKYNIHQGKFPCHICKQEVNSLRLYQQTKTLTWMCKDGHVSSVELVVKKKKDYERTV